MRLWQKILWSIAGLVGCSVLILSCYGFGEDILGFLPLFLIKCILGAVFFFIGIIIAVIFALGIIKIREFIKEIE